MHANITAFTEAGPSASGQLVAFVSINRLPDTNVEVTCRNRKGEMVSVAVPHNEWRRMVREAFSATCTTSA